MANMQKKISRIKMGLVTSWEYDADHTPKKERRKERPDDEEFRSLMETVRDALEEQGIVLENWWAQRGEHTIYPTSDAERRRQES
jgi:hypothetical protein